MEVEVEVEVEERCIRLRLTGTSHRRWIWLFLLAFITLLPAVFWGKIHDDEVIYWEIARNIGHGLGPISSVTPHRTVFVWHLPFPSLLAAPCAVLLNDIVPVRLFTAVVSALGAVLFFELAAEWFDAKTAWVSLAFLLTSFYWLRFGGRFYNDPFGFTFFWAALYVLRRRRPALGGFLAGLSLVSRELWALPVAVLAWIALRERQLWRFLGGITTPALLVVWWVVFRPGVTSFFRETAVFNQGHYLVNATAATPGAVIWPLLHAWLELVIAHGLSSLGVVLALFLVPQWPGLRPWGMLLAAVATISLVPGFILNGGFTQYGLLLTGFFSIIGAVGVLEAWHRLARGPVARLGFAPVLGVLLALQLAVGNVLIDRGALYGSTTVHGLGLWNDRAIIRFLQEHVAGQSIAGIHGAFVPTATRWYWFERKINELPDLQADWIVVYKKWVRVKPDPGLQVWDMGPYVVIQVKNQDALRHALRLGNTARVGL